MVVRFFMLVLFSCLILTIALDTFISLNVIRALSIIAMLLVFSSTIFVMVTNVKAVNYYEAHKGDNNATMAAMNMDYIS